jgi:hypothetical protein
MIFECFYYPTLNNNGDVIRSNENLREFNFGDTVPTKTLYYNYGQNFAIHQNSEIFIVEDGILSKKITLDDLKFPLKIIFGKGTQLKIFSRNDLSSIRLLLRGEKEKEKELGELFSLSLVLNRKIKATQYEIMSDLTNSSRDCNYINQQLDLRTKQLLEDLKIAEGKFYNLTIEDPNLKNSYLNYMNFSNKEDMLELSIGKYFKEGTDEYNSYIFTSSVFKSKPIYPKFKLDNLINSYNYRD